MNIENQKEELEKLENKSLLYKLKRYERKILKYLRKIFRKSNTEIIERHIEYMEKQEDEYNEAVKKENINYELRSKEININKKKEIDLIEENKKKLINEKKILYDDIITYLESIKNDKEKLNNFFNNTNIINIYINKHI